MGTNSIAVVQENLSVYLESLSAEALEKAREIPAFTRPRLQVPQDDDSDSEDTDSQDSDSEPERPAKRARLQIEGKQFTRQG